MATKKRKRKPRAIRFTRLHDDGSIKHAQRTIEKDMQLPKGSVRLVYPDGRRTRSDSDVDALPVQCGSSGRWAVGKSIVFGLLEREGRVYTRVVTHLTAEELMRHIQTHTHTRKGSVDYTDAFRGYQSLKRNGKHHVVSHRHTFVNHRTRNHINGIEGFGSYAKHVLYNYRGVSRYHFPMYLKEVEYRFNYRREDLF